MVWPRDKKTQRGGGEQDGTSTGLGEMLSVLLPPQIEPLDVDVLLRNTSGTEADFSGCKFPK